MAIAASRSERGRTQVRGSEQPVAEPMEQAAADSRGPRSNPWNCRQRSRQVGSPKYHRRSAASQPSHQPKRRILRPRRLSPGTVRQAVRTWVSRLSRERSVPQPAGDDGPVRPCAVKRGAVQWTVGIAHRHHRHITSEGVLKGGEPEYQMTDHVAERLRDGVAQSTDGRESAGSL